MRDELPLQPIDDPTVRPMARVGVLGVGSSLLLHVVLIFSLSGASLADWFASDSQEREILVAWGEGDGKASQVDEPEQSVITILPASTQSNDASDLKARIAASIEAAESQPRTDQLDELDRMARKLDVISDQRSLDQLADRLEDWLGLGPRSAESAASDGDATEPFDFTTAQVHDILRSETPEGVQYECVLLDASGRTERISMSEAEGRPLFEVMQRIKASPLLEHVYRRLAMPLIDQMLEAQRSASNVLTEPDDRASFETAPAGPVEVTAPVEAAATSEATTPQDATP